MLNLHLLRIFAAVAETMSFSRAAEIMYISQPAVSKAVIGLESQVGQPLIERGGRKVRLTEAGALLQERARTIFAVERSAEEDLQALRGLQSGILRVGASTTIATYLLPALLATFHHRYPGVDVRLTSLNTRAIAELLREYRLDVALVEGPVDDQHLSCTPWKTDELVVIAAPTHPYVRRVGSQGLPMAFLAEGVWLTREPGSGTREVVQEALERHGLELRHTLELGSTEAIKQAVAAGLGLAIVSRATIADQLALGRLTVLPVEGLAIQRTLSRLRVSGRTSSPAARAFEQMLAEAGDV